MKINILRIILIILLLGTFYIIFGFSSQDGDESSGVSRTITEKITSNAKWVQEKSEDEKQETLDMVEKVIRKIAHFSIYTVVGILLMALMSTYNLSNKKRAIISEIIGIIYASSDEIHQLFTPGRSAQITDVMIDSMGVLLGILLVILTIKLYKKLKKDSTKYQSV